MENSNDNPHELVICDFDYFLQFFFLFSNIYFVFLFLDIILISADDLNGLVVDVILEIRTIQ